MLETVKKILQLLSRRERRNFYIVTGLTLVTGLLEMVGVALILPFLAVITDPEVIHSNAVLSEIYTTLNFTSDRSFLIFLGLAVLGFILFSLLVRLASIFAIARFSNMRAYSLSSQLVSNYLHQPYAWFLNRNSADLGTLILSLVDQAVQNGLIPVMRIFAYAAVVLALLFLLLLIEPMVAILAAAVFGGSYIVIFLIARRTLSRLGRIILEADHARYKITHESMTGIKDVKVRGLETVFLQQFRDPSRRMAAARSLALVIAEMPRYLLEAIAIGGTVVFILFLLTWQGATLVEILPTLGVFALAGVRMLPALQGLYREFGTLKVTQPTIDELHADMMGTRHIALPRLASAEENNLPLRNQLELDSVSYLYPTAERPALIDLSLRIEARRTIGIVGGTGAGKTTLIDLILGLLPPQRGEIRVDGVAITGENLRAWQRNIGYVPQQIFLTDDTVAANIAFGIPNEEIDMAAVERAARVAELHNFIMTELPLGYRTTVGEQGVRLSGGQRQRIGIARALYHDPDVLILDEATSALDNLTERAVMDAVHNLGNAKTIVMIAHRLTTVRDCDEILMMEAGKVVGAGTYDELLGANQKFRALAGVAVS
jgi:ATP-binding cassette, subfamily B, bacterial PglK